MSRAGSSDLKLPEQPNVTPKCMLSLNNRLMKVSNGTLLVSLSSGRIQVWSHHETTESYITDFDAIHVAGDVSKWLIDVHFAYWSLDIHFSPLSCVCLFIFMLDGKKKTKNKTILFSTMSFFERLLFTHTMSTNVSHSNDNRHSKLLFIHGLSKGIHKSLDDYKFLVCFELYLIIFVVSCALMLLRNGFVRWDIFL